ncbi:MAG: hypothetical protein GKS00_01795 [Alphaproteobacteria bacterium]|nr:hypothetical protein [Alphaproteobacteria bacterium]
MKRTALAALLALAPLVWTTSAAALQIKQATGDGQVTATISAKEISRIGLAGDRVRMVNGDPDVDISHDEVTGDIYLKPAPAPLSKPLNLFVTSEKGFTYQLLLLPEAVPSEQILIRNEDALGGPARAGAWEQRTPFHAAVVEVMRAAAGAAALPAGYVRESVTDANVTDADVMDAGTRRRGLLIRRRFQITGSALQGIALKVRNTGTEPVSLSERDLFAPGQAAVYLPVRTVAPGASVTAFVVRRRTGGSQ